MLAVIAINVQQILWTYSDQNNAIIINIFLKSLHE